MAVSFNPNSRKKKLGSYPTLLVVFSITLALVVVGLFGLLLLHAHKLSESVRENLEVQVYLERDLPETELLRLQQDLGHQPYVVARDGRAQIRFVSKEDGARQLLQSTGEDFRQFLEDNPLRDAYALKIRPEYTDTLHLGQLQRSLRAQRGEGQQAHGQYSGQADEHARHAGPQLTPRTS